MDKYKPQSAACIITDINPKENGDNVDGWISATKRQINSCPKKYIYLATFTTNNNIQTSQQ